MRCSVAPPQRDAYFCSVRKPGIVLRVSQIAARDGCTASTNCAASVAFPDSSVRKLSIVRSCASSETSGPSSDAMRVPRSTRLPSSTCTVSVSPPRCAMISATRSPATTPEERLTTRARPRAVGAIVTALVTSPLMPAAPKSSASARSTAITASARASSSKSCGSVSAFQSMR